MLIAMILCWVLYAKSIIGLALPIIATVLFALKGPMVCIKVATRISKIDD